MANNSILNYSSFHPKPLVNSIPTVQNLCLRRICSNQLDFERQASELRRRLRARGYSTNCLAKVYNHAVSISRHQLLYKKKHESPLPELSRFIIRYSAQHSGVKDILKRHWHLLQADPRIKPYITNVTQITFKKAKSLRDRLFHSHLASNDSTQHCDRVGTFKCNHCNICSFIQECSKIRLPNGSGFHAKHFVDCKTAGVVYLFICECGCYYVG